MNIAIMSETAVWQEKSKELIKINKSGFDNVVFNLSYYCSDQEIEHREDILEMSETESMDYSLLSFHPEDMEDRAKMWQMQNMQLGLKNTFAVAPYQLVDTKRNDSQELIKSLVKYSILACKNAGCETILVKPMILNPVDEDDFIKNKQFYIEISKDAIRHGITVLIPNQYKIYNNHIVRGYWSDPYTLNDFISAVNKELEISNLGICVDIGVCNLLGQKVDEFVDVTAKNIKAVIIRDNDGLIDNALIPFASVNKNQCRVDWQSVINGLRKIDFDGQLVFDFSDSAKNVSNLLKMEFYAYAKKLTEFITWQINMEKTIKKYDKRVLFGAGNMCRNYMICYGKDYPPLFTCDNNANIWDTEFEGLTIKNPVELKNISDDCAIFICNVFYDEIDEQLREMGITNPIERFNDEYLPIQVLDRFDAKKRRVLKG